MAITTTDLLKRYDCNGSNKNFPITFDYLDEANIAVQLYDGSLGTYTTLALTTDYTIANDTVTTVATYAAKYDIILLLDPALTQTTDWVENSYFTAASWENAVDKLTLICQSLQEQVNRCVKGPPADAESLTWELEGSIDRAGGYPHFNAITGNLETVSSLAPSTATVTAFAETLLDDPSLSAFLTTIELSTATAGAIRDQGVAGSGLLVKVLPISNWNMDTTTAVSVATGVQFLKVRAFNGVVYDDALSYAYPVIHYPTDTGLANELFIIAQADGSLCTMIPQRFGGSEFDSSLFDLSPFNRGYITVWYSE